MKKTQLDQPFVIIFGVIVMALVLIFGADMIIKSIKLSSDVEAKTFMDNLNSKVEECYNLGYQSIVGLDKLSVPTPFDYACFIDPNIALNTNIPYPINSTLSGYMNIERTENFYLLESGRNGKVQSSTIKNLKVSDNPTCFSIKDRRISAVLENMGEYVLVKRV